jgi:hypothetical protein
VAAGVARRLEVYLGRFEGPDAEHAEAWAVEELASLLAMERIAYGLEPGS